MSWKAWAAAGLAILMLGVGLPARAGDLKITLPKRSRLTPVQRLNQEGVAEVRKHKYSKAEALFYKAYLLDPDDPFTLNNLGYISELNGQVDRAQTFYALAAQEATDAAIAKASLRRVQGRTLKEALSIPDMQLQVNHDNVEAVRLLAEGRGAEADLLLQQAMHSDPNNAFTLNNMGVAKELEGEPQAALKDYDAAAATESGATAEVTMSPSWLGKPVSAMAQRNARSLRRRLETEMTAELNLAELNTRGVAAINRNELVSAEKDFREAYSLNPSNPFAVNNLGYLAELEGDRETAQYFYNKARSLGGSDLRVGLATRSSAEGQRMAQVASDSNASVETEVTRERDLRREHEHPILLLRRDDSVVQEPPIPSPSVAPPQ
jgi:Flp pilus assembly protein TadD